MTVHAVAYTPEVPDFLAGLTPANAGAYARFLRAGLPGPKSEAYKYTNLPRALLKIAPVPAPCVPEVSGAQLTPVVVDGACDDQAGFETLNVALTEGGYRLLIPAGQTIQDVRIVWPSLAGSLQSPHLHIVVEAGATLVLHEVYDLAPGAWMNAALRIDVAEGAVVRHTRTVAGAGVMTAGLQGRIAAEGDYTHLLLSSPVGMVRQDVCLDLLGTQARGVVHAANLVTDGAHSDLSVLVRHLAAECYSSQQVRNIAGDLGRAVFQGKIFVDRAGQKTDGYQLSKSMLLAQTAEIDVKPELEIYADDVKCSHGATTGALDDQQLFYLMARGVPRAEARALLISAFVMDVFADLPEDMRTEFAERVDSWMSGVSS